MKLHKKLTIITVIVIIIGVGTWFAVTQWNKSEKETPMDTFTKCLTEKGVNLYTTYWCPHCTEQKKLFGESLKYVNVVECDPQGENAQIAKCEEKGVTSIPAWEFETGKLDVGVKTIEQLSEKTGCLLPTE